MDIALQSLKTQHRQVTILDAPGHKDFVPNMISGASQADCALLVVDASPGEFEAGFDRGGQTREHVILVRSLGVSQIIIAINKLDVVRNIINYMWQCYSLFHDKIQWDQSRYKEICKLMRPFLVQSGFHPSKTQFVPVGAMDGVNLAEKPTQVEEFTSWYQGPTLVDCLGMRSQQNGWPSI